MTSFVTNQTSSLFREFIRLLARALSFSKKTIIHFKSKTNFNESETLSLSQSWTIVMLWISLQSSN